MGGKNELIWLRISAWSLKARWALKVHNIQYTTTGFTPLLGALWLRWRTWNWSTRVTTPVLFTADGDIIPESYGIAQWAELHSNSPSKQCLFPEGRLEDVTRWDGMSDSALYFARKGLLQWLQAHPAALLRMLPPALSSLGPLSYWFASWYITKYEAKYADLSASTSLDKVKGILRELQQAVKANGGYILGSFTYADVAMAVAMQVVEPIGPPHSKIPEAQRKALTNTELKAEFQDLVAWRDGIFQKHFPGAA